MALELQELRTEQVQQLKQLVQSPAWALLKTRWQRLALRSESAKASSLRKGESGVYQQGVSDGVAQAMQEPEKALRELGLDISESMVA